MHRAWVAAVVLLWTGAAAAREVALTFDDIPGVAIPGGCDFRKMSSANRRILATLKKHNAPALGLVVEGHCGPNVARPIFEQWLAAGHDLGNHTWSHHDLNRVGVAHYQQDIVRGEALLRILLPTYNKKLRYFRFPGLHSGDTPEKKKAIEDFLRKRGYSNAVVTFDNQEWVFASAYARALVEGNEELKKRIVREYLDHMDATYDFFEKLSVKVFGREIPQVLLLHANALNADVLDQVLTRLERRRYSFVSTDQVLRDPAYSTPDSYIGPRGLSWLHRWGLTKGIPVQNEPREPRWLLEKTR